VGFAKLAVFWYNIEIIKQKTMQVLNTRHKKVASYLAVFLLGGLITFAVLTSTNAANFLGFTRIDPIRTIGDPAREISTAPKQCNTCTGQWREVFRGAVRSIVSGNSNNVDVEKPVTWSGLRSYQDEGYSFKVNKQIAAGGAGGVDTIPCLRLGLFASDGLFICEGRNEGERLRLNIGGRDDVSYFGEQGERGGSGSFSIFVSK